MDRCRESVQEHYTFSHELLEMQQWVTLVTQKLESHQRDTGPWDTQSQEAKIEVKMAFPAEVPRPKGRLERLKFPHWGTETPPAQELTVCVCVLQSLLAEVPEKEAQLPLIEAHGALVMEKSSPEGAAVVREELTALAESWRALRLLEDSLLR